MRLTSEAFALYRLGAEADDLRMEQSGPTAGDQVEDGFGDAGGDTMPAIQEGLYGAVSGLGMKWIEEDP